MVKFRFLLISPGTEPGVFFLLNLDQFIVLAEKCYVTADAWKTIGGIVWQMAADKGLRETSLVFAKDDTSWWLDLSSSPVYALAATGCTQQTLPASLVFVDTAQKYILKLCLQSCAYEKK